MGRSDAGVKNSLRPVLNLLLVAREYPSVGDEM
jgi:hypothetical protein